MSWFYESLDSDNPEEVGLEYAKFCNEYNIPFKSNDKNISIYQTTQVLDFISKRMSMISNASVISHYGESWQCRNSSRGKPSKIFR